MPHSSRCRYLAVSIVLAGMNATAAIGDAQVRTGAEQAFEQGKRLLAKRTYTDLQQAIALLEEAVALDPDHARAHAALADAYSLIYEYGKAERAARQALALDDSLPEAHASLGFIQMHAHWDWDSAGNHFRRSIALDPRNPQTRHWHAIYLEVMGRGDEAVAEARVALELEPRSSAYALGVGYRLFWARRYTESVAQLNTALEMHPSAASGHYFLGRCYVETSRFEQAAAHFAKAAEIDPLNRNLDGALALLDARAGNITSARRRLHSLLDQGQPFASHIASVYIVLGEHDAALHWLDKAVDRRGVAVVWLKVDPRFDPLRADERFEAILTRVGLAASQQDSR